MNKKITAEQRKEIIETLSKQIKITELAKKYNVSRQAIYAIKDKHEKANKL